LPHDGNLAATSVITQTLASTEMVGNEGESKRIDVHEASAGPRIATNAAAAANGPARSAS